MHYSAPQNPQNFLENIDKIVSVRQIFWCCFRNRKIYIWATDGRGLLSHTFTNSLEIKSYVIINESDIVKLIHWVSYLKVKFKIFKVEKILRIRICNYL